ncbi:MAG: agmatinase, partial [Clostridiales bacterium]|nr:agmatinase [Clostridiales bacterium]
MKNKVQTFVGCTAGYDEARVALFGAPFDGTTSFRPGARFGPAAIRAESFGIETYSPYADRDLFDCAVFDAGDLELPFGSAERALEIVEVAAAEILSDGKIPFLLGGEHLVTLAAARAAVRRYPDIAFVHFDAHADLREEYVGEPLSHASVMRRVWDMAGDGRIFQFGIRSGDRDEFAFARGHTELHRFDLSAFSEALERIGGRPVYFTLDLDVLDPSCFPGTGTPEPG